MEKLQLAANQKPKKKAPPRANELGKNNMDNENEKTAKSTKKKKLPAHKNEAIKTRNQLDRAERSLARIQSWPGNAGECVAQASLVCDAIKALSTALEALPEDFESARPRGRPRTAPAELTPKTKVKVRERYLSKYPGVIGPEDVLEVKASMNGGQVQLQHPNGAIMFVHRRELETGSAQ